MYDFEKLALSYFFVPELGSDASKENISKQVIALRKYVTIIKHLSSCPDSWEFLQMAFQKFNKDVKLSWNEINFADFRALDDELLLIVYVKKII